MSFSLEATKAESLFKQSSSRSQTGVTTRRKVENMKEMLMKKETLDIKDPSTISVFEYVLKKTLKGEADLFFIEKFLDEVRFFKELKQSLSLKIYKELLLSINLKEVHANELILFKSINIEREVNEGNFYIIGKGEVIEFQKLIRENQEQTLQHLQLNSKISSPSPRNRMSKADASPVRNINSGQSPERERGGSNTPSPLKPNKNPLLQRTNSISNFQKGNLDQEKQMIQKINDGLQASFLPSNDSPRTNFKMSKFMNESQNTPSTSTQQSKNMNDSQNTPRIFSSQSRIISEPSNTPRIFVKQSRLIKFSGFSQQLNRGEELEDKDGSPQTKNRDEGIEQFIQEAKKYFSYMKAKSILKVGGSFGEFDKGNLNLISHGYMAKTDGWLVELSGEIYNELISKHREKLIENKIEYLKQFGCFKGYSKQKMKNALKYFTESVYYRGNALYTEGDSADFIYFIKQGEVQFSKVIEMVRHEEEEEEEDEEKQQQNASAEKEFHFLFQGKRYSQKSKLFKLIQLTTIGRNSQFGESEVIAKIPRVYNAIVVSLTFEVYQIHAQVFIDEFLSSQETFNFCEKESKLRDQEKEQLFKGTISKLPLQTFDSQINEEYLRKTIEVQQNKFQEAKKVIIDSMSNRIPFELMKRTKNMNEVANYKDGYLTINQFKQTKIEDQSSFTERFLKNDKTSRMQLLNKFNKVSSQFETQLSQLPFYHHIQQNMEFKNPQPTMIHFVRDKVKNMLEYCKSEQQLKRKNIKKIQLKTKEGQLQPTCLQVFSNYQEGKSIHQEQQQNVHEAQLSQSTSQKIINHTKQEEEQIEDTTLNKDNNNHKVNKHEVCSIDLSVSSTLNIPETKYHKILSRHCHNQNSISALQTPSTQNYLQLSSHQYLKSEEESHQFITKEITSQLQQQSSQPLLSSRRQNSSGNVGQSSSIRRQLSIPSLKINSIPSKKIYSQEQISHKKGIYSPISVSSCNLLTTNPSLTSGLMKSIGSFSSRTLKTSRDGSSPLKIQEFDINLLSIQSGSQPQTLRSLKINENPVKVEIQTNGKIQKIKELQKKIEAKKKQFKS